MNSRDLNSPRRLIGLRTLGGAIGAIVLAAGAFAVIRGAANDSPSPTPSTPPPTTTTAPSTTSTVPDPPTTTTTRRAERVSVPTVVGIARDDAITQLAGAGLESRVQTLPSPGTPAGFVLSQSPLPGVEIGKGSTVVLVVSG